MNQILYKLQSNSLITPLLTTPSKGMNNALSAGVLFIPLEGMVSRGIISEVDSIHVEVYAQYIHSCENSTVEQLMGQQTLSMWTPPLIKDSRHPKELLSEITKKPRLANGPGSFWLRVAGEGQGNLANYEPMPSLEL